MTPTIFKNISFADGRVDKSALALLYSMPHVFVQGDREPNDSVRDAATILGLGLRAKGWGTSLGAYGGLVEVLEATSVSCICHETEIKDHGPVKFATSPAIDCSPLSEIVVGALGAGMYYDNELDHDGDTQNGVPATFSDNPFEQARKEIAWANRLGVWMGMSQAYCFFAGREGTMAHLVPVLAYNAKGWSKTKARPVALIGWDPLKVSALMQLMGLTKETKWFHIFSLEEIGKAIEFLTA